MPDLLSSDLLDGLNEAQRTAVEHVEGPLLVLAGPGSGKTRVLTRRIAYMIAYRGIPAEEILAVTFTNKAAAEMQHRVRSAVFGPQPTVSTFHRLCSRLLRKYGPVVGIGANFSILDQDDRLQQVSRVMKELRLDATHFPPRRVDQRISQLKNDLVAASAFAEQPHDFFEQIVADVYPVYQERLRKQNAVDFDDLLLLVAELLEQHPDVRARLDQRYRYMLVDEYQDTNLAQYRIARLLKLDQPNLCATGDPDQSIYSWRGANPENVFHFERDYPGAVVVRLERNYRSTGNILAAADGLIAHNVKRKIKRLTTESPLGAPVMVYCHASDEAEAHHVAESIRQAVDQGERKYSDFAVFLRVSSLWGRFETAFRARHIPYQVIGGTSFFQRKEIKDVLAYARLACNPLDDAAFGRIVNVPARGLGETTLERLREAARQSGLSLLEASRNNAFIAKAGVRGKQRTTLAEFADSIDALTRFAEEAPKIGLEAILEASKYRALLEAEDDEEEDKRDSIENLEGMLRDAEAFADQEPGATLRDFLEMVGLSSSGDDRNAGADRATIMTLHAAKGLEFPVVYLAAFEQDILPHERAVQEGNIEEERRLAFVGLTRAKESLFLSYTCRRAYQGRLIVPSPSRFLNEIPAEAMRREDFYQASAVQMQGAGEYSQENDYEEPVIQIVRKSSEASPTDRFRKGMLVDHPRYGIGRILDLDGVGKDRKATIQFPAVGVKRFVLDKAPLEPI